MHSLSVVLVVLFVIAVLLLLVLKKFYFNNKQGGNIEDSDIMYKDDLVCILKPNIKKGVLIFHDYDDVSPDIIQKDGLKTALTLYRETHIQVRRLHPYIFFRAPYFGNSIDYTSVESEIKSLYADMPLDKRIFIRVDPDRTFVMPSELREGGIDPINNKITITEYFKKIRAIEEMKKQYDFGMYIYNLYSYSAIRVDYRTCERILNEPDKNRSLLPINMSCEVLVSKDLTPDYFVNLT